jgi:anti-sigma B factor antagonist
MTATAESRVERISLQGPMSIYNAAELKARMLQAVASAGQVELDLARVEELDTAGFQVLVLAKREAVLRGHRLRIVAHSPEVQEVLDLCGMASWFGDPLLVPASPVTSSGG